MFNLVDVEYETLGGELRLGHLEDAGLEKLLILWNMIRNVSQLLLERIIDSDTAVSITRVLLTENRIFNIMFRLVLILPLNTVFSLSVCQEVCCQEVVVVLCVSVRFRIVRHSNHLPLDSSFRDLWFSKSLWRSSLGFTFRDVFFIHGRNPAK